MIACLPYPSIQGGYFQQGTLIHTNVCDKCSNRSCLTSEIGLIVTCSYGFDSYRVDSVVSIVGVNIDLPTQTKQKIKIAKKTSKKNKQNK